MHAPKITVQWGLKPTRRRPSHGIITGEEMAKIRDTYERVCRPQRLQQVSVREVLKAI